MNHALKVIIVDDEEPAREAIVRLLQLNFPDVEVLALCADVAEAVRAIHTHQPDLVFLDIEMPGYSGLRLVEFFNPNELNFLLVFVTAYNDYAVKAFEMSALDYILKPISSEALHRVIEKASSSLSHRALAERVHTLQGHLENAAVNQIALPLMDGYEFVKTEEIVRLEGDSAYTHFYLQSNQHHLVSRTLKEFEDLLCGGGDFVRVHKRHIANLKHVKKYLKADGGTLVMNDGASLPIGRTKRQELLEMLQRFLP